jgi:hypothetical protein
MKKKIRKKKKVVKKKMREKKKKMRKDSNKKGWLGFAADVLMIVFGETSEVRLGGGLVTKKRKANCFYKKATVANFHHMHRSS